MWILCALFLSIVYTHWLACFNIVTYASYLGFGFILG
jgi:hypothetical protein